MHISLVVGLLGAAQLSSALPNFRQAFTTNSGTASSAVSVASVPVAASSSLSSTSSAKGRSAFQTAVPVAAADTPRDIMDLGISPALVRVPVKPNPDFTPNVTLAVAAAQAKYVVIEEQFQLEKREELAAQERMELIKRARTALKTSMPRQPLQTTGSTSLKCKYFPALCNTVTPAAAPTSTVAPMPVTTLAPVTTAATTKPAATTSATPAAPAVKSLPTLVLAAQNIQLDSEFLSEIYIGSNGDKIDVVMDTGSADLWMFSTDCVGCSGTHDYYNPSTSTTFRNTTTPFKLLYGDGSATSGLLAYDTVNLAGAPIQAQSIDVAHTISSNLQANSMDGILGLGFPNLMSVQGQTGVSTPVANMMSQNLIPQGQFGLQYIKSNHWSYLGGGGAWTFGGVDTSVISGALNIVPLVKAQYWMVNMLSVAVGSVYSYVPTQPVIVDSGTTLILLDPASVAKIHAYLPGGRVSPDNSHYQIFCNASDNAYVGTRNAYFNLGGVKYGVPAIDLAWYPEAATPGYCYSGIQPWSNSFGILGVMFLKNVYAVFDQQNKQMKFSGRVDIATLTD